MRQAVRVCAALAVVIAMAGNGNAAASATADRAPTAPRGLVVDDRTNPLGVQGTPQFGWLPQDPDGNEVQTAYQLVVAAGGRDGMGLGQGRVRGAVLGVLCRARPRPWRELHLVGAHVGPRRPRLALRAGPVRHRAG